MSEISETLCVAVHHPEIDAIHAELAELAATLSDADDTAFASFYPSLISHTEAHFAHEERLMRESAFPHAAEHLVEHRQMLQEMKQFQLRRISISRAYIEQRLPERLNLHIIRMDSLLAAWLRSD
jgi:hemerythrin